MARLRTLPEALAKAARADAGYLFLSADGGGAAPDAASGTYRSYADMQRLSWQVARALRDARVRRGDLVAIVLADAEQFLTTLFGASMAGVVPASLYPPSTMGELPRYLEQTARILRACSARVVVTSRTLAPSFEAARASCPDLALVLAREDFDGDAPEPAAPPSLDDIVLVQFTSGSTSRPKGVALSHRNLAANVDAINGPAGLATTDADIGVSWLPLNHDMGLIGMALGPLFSARRGVLLPPHVFVKRPGEWLRAISRHRATISFDLDMFAASAGTGQAHRGSNPGVARRLRREIRAGRIPCDQLSSVLRPRRARARGDVPAAPSGAARRGRVRELWIAAAWPHVANRRRGGAAGRRRPDW